MSDRPDGFASVQTPTFRSVNQTVYSTLRKAIFDGSLAASDRIVEGEVARKLGISRSPVREALHRLEQAGLVRHEPRRGWFVVGLTAEDTWDLYNTRALVEAVAARRVARNGDPRLLARLEALLEGMIAAAERNNLDELAATDVQFHEMIVQSGGSTQLHRIWTELHPQDWTIMSVIKLSELSPLEIAERHQAVLDALASKDPDWAEAVIKRHILELAREVVALST